MNQCGGDNISINIALVGAYVEFREVILIRQIAQMY